MSHNQTVETNSRSVSRAVIDAVAAVEGIPPSELTPPLYDVVDPEALDALVQVRTGTNGDTHVTFTHEGHAITVNSYGVITITPGHELTAEKGERAREDDC